MINKFLTENARIADAYMKVRKAGVTESTKSKCGGSLLKALKGQLPIDGKGSKRTGSKLGVRKVMPFDKRDPKPCCTDGVHLKRTYGNGMVRNEKLVGGTKVVKHEMPSRTGSKLDAGKVMQFEKRDEKPTSVGRIRNVKNINRVSRVSLRKLGESAEGFEDVSDVDIEEIDDVEDVNGDVSCEHCMKKDELLDMVLTVFEQIYDNLDDDCKETVDELKDEIMAVVDGDGDDEETDDEETDDGKDENDNVQSTVNEASPTKGVKTIKTMSEIGRLAHGAAGRSGTRLMKSVGELEKLTGGKKINSIAQVQKEIKRLKEMPKLDGEGKKTLEALERIQKDYDDATRVLLKKLEIDDKKMNLFKSKYNEYLKQGDGMVDAAAKAAKDFSIDWTKHHKLLMSFLGIGGGLAVYGTNKLMGTDAATVTKTGQEGSKGKEGVKKPDIEVDSEHVGDSSSLTGISRRFKDVNVGGGTKSGLTLTPEDIDALNKRGFKTDRESVLRALLGADIGSIGSIPDYLIKTFGGQTGEEKQQQRDMERKRGDIEAVRKQLETETDPMVRYSLYQQLYNLTGTKMPQINNFNVMNASKADMAAPSDSGATASSDSGAATKNADNEVAKEVAKETDAIEGNGIDVTQNTTDTSTMTASPSADAEQYQTVISSDDDSHLQ